MKNASDFLPTSLKKKYQANSSLREILDQYIDIELQQHYQILAYRKSILTIGLDSAIWRMRFQQRLLYLRLTLQKSGYSVKQIFFKIVPTEEKISKKIYNQEKKISSNFSPQLTETLKIAAQVTNDEVMKDLFMNLLKD
jgi:hypothetical protein